MGNAKREAKGSFFLIDTKEWKVKGTSTDYNLFFLFGIISKKILLDAKVCGVKTRRILVTTSGISHVIM